MVLSQQLVPGTIISISGKLYRVETCVKVTVPKKEPFLKAKLKDLSTQKNIEKNFKVGQEVQDVAMEQRPLEFLYPEGKDFLFLDVDKLEQVLVPSKVIQDQVNYLKEGVEVTASFYGDTLFTIELPQFLELMVANIEGDEEEIASNTMTFAELETGARVEVPGFIEPGDVIKVDTKTNDYVQRV